MSEHLPDLNVSEVRTERNADFRPLFSNQSRVRIGPGEFTFTFSFTDDVPGIGRTNTELFTVTVTPTLAKRMTISLVELIKLFEENFGPILPEPTQPIDVQTYLENFKRAMDDWAASATPRREG